LVAGWSALLIYSAACSPVGLGLAAMAGSFDASHRVVLAASERGGRVVLQHGARCVQHRHGMMAKALTAFARPGNTADSDHVLQFNSTYTLKFQGESTTPRPPKTASLAVSAFCKHLEFCSPVRGLTIPSLRSLHESGALGSWRVTVLLI
jgi:hypothetical protein